MTTFVTSDTHFGHRNIMVYCPWRMKHLLILRGDNRPDLDGIEPTIEEHDEALIAAWNSTVQPGDMVYHLGDFALCKRQVLAELRQRLNGRIIIVLGNHDRTVTAMEEAGFKALHVAEVGGEHGIVWCRHNPTHFDEHELESASLLLHGHWHGQRTHYDEDQDAFKPQHRRKLVDVGVDARQDFRPVDLDELIMNSTGAAAW